ncbi:phosphatidylglycerophosphatase A [Curvibacter sp. CHRR-16]|uniref:phosphatidylglycerophosphatase A family protein n=1 Tax=Curvibacter sp. CHRR-16 TaxID=2835872 RepID=UPI001BD93AB6|nr:phosphatidylglycerophosphatase A [Curvibacter sp. CHRR-16]MBT0570588.1 phosphatidylglycerophosphatase A [Curvibacter sp. CHRR-16]
MHSATEQTPPPADTTAPSAHTASRVPAWLARLATIVATGFGSGLSPKAPGTVGTLWAWVVFALSAPHMGDGHWAMVMAVGIPLGVWVSSVAAVWLGHADPSAVVVDEILAFWLVLWLITPCSWQQQLAAFVLFRFFDAVKPGPVGWADRLFHQRSERPWLAWWQTGIGIMLDDFVAAGCTLFIMAWWRF